MRKKIKVIAVLILGFVALSATATLAGNPYINVPEQQRLAREAQLLWWQSLSPRQQNLARAIDNAETLYYNQTGNYIPVTQPKLLTLMQYVGAERQEAGFVYERMQHYMNMGQKIDEADSLIACAHKNPTNWWMPGVCN